MALADLDDFYGIDGQAGAGSLYQDFISFGSMTNAMVVDCRIDPAETVACMNGEGINFIRTEFTNMSPENPALVLGSQGTLNANNVAPARYTDVTFNGTGGELTVANAVVYGLETSGNFKINVQSGYLNDWSLNGESNVILNTQGGTIRNINANGAYFDERSSLAGGFFLGGEMVDTTLLNIDARGAQFSDGLHIAGGEISGDFSGARFSNMSIATDTRNMQISDSTSFSGVNMFNPVTGQYQRVDSRQEFESINAAYAQAEETRAQTAPQVEAPQAQAAVAASQPAAADPQPSNDPIAMAMAIGRNVFAPAIASIGQPIEAPADQPTIAELQRGPVLPAPDRPLEPTAPAGGETVRTLIVGGEHFASVSDVQNDRQGANENQLTLNTPEAQEALAQITEAAMGEGYMR